MNDITTILAPVSVPAERPGKPLVLRLAARCLAGLTRPLRVAEQTRRDLAYLQACDDRTLADIGLTRAQIESAVRFGRYY